MNTEVKNLSNSLVLQNQEKPLRLKRRMELAVLSTAVPAVLGLIVWGANDKDAKQTLKPSLDQSDNFNISVPVKTNNEYRDITTDEVLTKMLDYMESSQNRALKEAMGDFKYLLINNLFDAQDWKGYGTSSVMPFRVELWGGFPTPDKSSWKIVLVGSSMVKSDVELAFHFYQAVAKQKLLTEAKNNGVVLTENEIAGIDAKAWVETMNKAYCPLRNTVNIDYFNKLCDTLRENNPVNVY